MIKFRTMINNAESVGTGLYSFEDDPESLGLVIISDEPASMSCHSFSMYWEDLCHLLVLDHPSHTN